MRDNALIQLSRDHSRVEELVLAAGVLAPEKAAAHPDANVVTRAVGAHADIEIETVQLALRNDDRFLLCTDGLYRGLSDHSLTRELGSGSVPSAITQRLMAETLAGTASDNVTCIAVIYSGD